MSVQLRDKVAHSIQGSITRVAHIASASIIIRIVVNLTVVMISVSAIAADIVANTVDFITTSRASSASPATASACAAENTQAPKKTWSDIASPPNTLAARYTERRINAAKTYTIPARAGDTSFVMFDAPDKNEAMARVAKGMSGNSGPT